MKQTTLGLAIAVLACAACKKKEEQPALYNSLVAHTWVTEMTENPADTNSYDCYLGLEWKFTLEDSGGYRRGTLQYTQVPCSTAVVTVQPFVYRLDQYNGRAMIVLRSPVLPEGQAYFGEVTDKHLQLYPENADLRRGYLYCTIGFKAK